jgi:hypothetical protein
MDSYGVICKVMSVYLPTAKQGYELREQVRNFRNEVDANILPKEQRLF